jgi:hypothetical protein
MGETRFIFPFLKKQFGPKSSQDYREKQHSGCFRVLLLAVATAQYWESVVSNRKLSQRHRPDISGIFTCFLGNFSRDGVTG